MRYLSVITMILLGFSLAASAGEESVYQVSTIESLLGGAFEGVVAVGSIDERGDFGLGTFDALDGEMVLLDGECYRVNAEGDAVAVPDDETSPFLAVTGFDADMSFNVEESMTLGELEAYISSRIPDKGMIYAVKVTGSFNHVRTRAPRRQTKPYPTLKEALVDQPTFGFDGVSGTMVGFYMPDVMGSGMNVPGYHFHFLNDDASRGGHVLECTTFDIKIELDETPGFDLELVPGSHQEARDGGSIRELE